MPYYITKNHPECKSGWATVKSNYEIVGCHKTKQSAINQMVAISRAEDMEPGGTHPRDKKTEAAASELKVGVQEAEKTYKVPEGVQSAAKRALRWISEGKAGDGFTSVGRRRAQQLAAGGSVSRDTVARMKSYLARHQVDKKAEGFNSGEKGFPSPGRVAYDSWGGEAGYTWVRRINLDKKK